jgi:hypothetical protein
VFGSPTATLEVVGNTGKLSSEKAGVGGSTPSLATIIPKDLVAFGGEFPTHDPTHDSAIRSTISH